VAAAASCLPCSPLSPLSRAQSALSSEAPLFHSLHPLPYALIPRWQGRPNPNTTELAEITREADVLVANYGLHYLHFDKKLFVAGAYG
jgi:hypothetical protein